MVDHSMMHNGQDKGHLVRKVMVPGLLPSLTGVQSNDEDGRGKKVEDI